MKSLLQWTALSILIIGATPAMMSLAAEAPTPTGKDLAEAKHCNVCHDGTTPKSGPAFREVARRYSGLNNGKAMIARIIHTGSGTPTAVYHWSSSTMPPETVRVPVSDAEADVLADYVLSFK